MSFAYMPLYTGDYVRDTQHLSCSEHGIYLKLLMHCWDQKGPVPLDERKLCGIVNARSGDEIEALRRVLGEFFVRMEDGWYQPRLQREVERCQGISNARSRAGREGATARMAEFRVRKNNDLANAKQMPSISVANVQQVTPSPSPSLKKNTNTPPLPPKGGEGFADFWNAYPRKTAKANAIKAFQRIAPDAVLLQSMIAAVRQQSASEQWRKDGGQFVPHPATWLNGRRWEDEAEVPATANRSLFDRAL